MKKTIIIFITMLTIIGNLKGQPETIWQLLMDGSIIRWAYSGGDEFNGTQLDNSKWYTCGDGWNREHGNELQYYLDNNIVLDNGILKLVAKREPGYYDVWRFDGGAHVIQKYFEYTSGWIQPKMKFKYGLFEIRFKLPVGKGLWPAFWLYGGNPNEEFDIFEYKGETPNKIHIDMHCPNGCDNYNPSGLYPYNFGGWVTASGNFSDSYNDMMGEWGPGACFWYLNGQEFAVWWGDLNYQENIIANLAIANDAGPFEPGPDNTTPFPAYFEIDFIRVWTRLDCEQTITISNYNQAVTDPTVITGQNINVSNMTLSQGQSLKLIATDGITIEPNTTIEGDFEAKIVECPGPKKKEENFFNQSDSALKIISSIEPDSINGNNNKQAYANIENPPLLYIKVFPNPTEGKITIEFDGKIERNIKIEFINSSGQNVFSKDNITEKTLNIDISHLPKGIYFLKGTFGDKSVSDKIILN